MTERKEIIESVLLEAIAKIKLQQTGWESSEDVMTFNGKPIGMTIASRSIGIDRWWPDLQHEIVKALIPYVNALINSVSKESQ